MAKSTKNINKLIREFTCLENIIDPTDGEIFTKDSVYYGDKKDDRPFLIGIGGIMFEIFDNNQKKRRIADLGDNLLSKFSIVQVSN